VVYLEMLQAQTKKTQDEVSAAEKKGVCRAECNAKKRNAIEPQTAKKTEGQRTPTVKGIGPNEYGPEEKSTPLRIARRGKTKATKEIFTEPMGGRLVKGSRKLTGRKAPCAEKAGRTERSNIRGSLEETKLSDEKGGFARSFFKEVGRGCVG